MKSSADIRSILFARNLGPLRDISYWMRRYAQRRGARAEGSVLGGLLGGAALGGLLGGDDE